MTGPMTNIAGVYKLSTRRVCFDTGFNQDTVGHIFTKFEKAGKAFKVGEFIIIPSWPKHQRWEKAPKIRDGIISVLQELPTEIIQMVNDLGYMFDLALVDQTIIASKFRKSISGATVKRVYEKFGYCCSKCKLQVGLQLHHVKPVKEGGGNDFENLELLCTSCHKNYHSPDRVSGLESESTYPSNYSDLDSDLDSDIDLGKSVANVPPTKSAKPLSRPTIQEVTDYCKDRGNNVDPQKWFDHYTSNGWKVGRNSMKDWKAAVRTWERSSFSTNPKNDEPMTDEQRRERVNQILRGTGA